MKNITSKKLKSFIAGTLLGDSAIERNGKVFKCKQINKDIIDFKYSILSECFQKVTMITTPAHNCGKWNHQELFEVRVKDEYFKKLFPKFYNSERKFLTLDQLTYLDDLGLAMWFADDGTTPLIGLQKGHVRTRRVLLCTECFNYEEHELIQKYFKRFWDLEVRIVGRDNGDGKTEKKYRISFSLLDAQYLFSEIIGKYFLEYFPSMLYKLDLGYLTNSRTVTDKYWKFFNEQVKAHPSFESQDRLKKYGITR